MTVIDHEPTPAADAGETGHGRPGVGSTDPWERRPRGRVLPGGDRRGDDPDDDRWWRRAACAGRDPAWWSSDERPMWQNAVRLCLSCPVRDSCLDDALRQRDNGVIRGGMLLVDTSRGYTMVPLICAHCGLRPVRLTESGGVPRYCGRTCQVASHQRRGRDGQRGQVTGRIRLERREQAGVPATNRRTGPDGTVAGGRAAGAARVAA